jgi:hypothetical protein
MRRAGLQRDALSSQVIDVLEGARRRPAVKRLTTKGICRDGKLQDQQLTIGLDSGIGRVSTVFSMERVRWLSSGRFSANRMR